MPTDSPPDGTRSLVETADFPLLPLRQSVLFPGVVTPLAVHRGKSLALIEALEQAGQDMVVAGTQRIAEIDDPRLQDLSAIGTVARVLGKSRDESGQFRVTLVGLRRVTLEALTQENPYLRVRVSNVADPPAGDAESAAYAASVRDSSLKLFSAIPETPASLSELIRGADGEASLANLVSANIDTTPAEAVQLLEAVDPKQQLRLLLSVLARLLEMAKLRDRISTTVQQSTEAAQRSYYLREQLKAIRDELKREGGSDGELDAVREKLDRLPLPDPVRALSSRTLSRMQDHGDGGAEYVVALKFLQHLAALPWSHEPPAVPDVAAVRAELGRLHFGADEVMDWVIEELAVRSRASHASQVLCLVGPPGVGKTSIARAIAGALRRPLQTISLAGVYDATFIRGHRRTYTGSEPGNLATALQDAGTMAPVIVLDEIDKAGRDSARGDLSAALLLAVDPLLNHQFVDDYMGIALDLSKVLFIATANQVDHIYPPLRSRMRVITFWGYSPDDKLVIARNYILPRLVRNHGLSGLLEIEDEALRQMIARYTQEAGVRELARLIERICRRCAAMLAPGDKGKPVIVTAGGLDSFLGAPTIALHTSVPRARIGRVNAVIIGDAGGTVVPIDSIQTPGKGNVTITGLDVGIQERVSLAVSVARRRTDQLRLGADVWTAWNLHMHVDANMPRLEVHEVDLALYLSIVSTVTAKAAPERVGVIGTIDLHGDVGGCRDFAARMAAAQRYGLEAVIIPNDHEQDVLKLPRRISSDLSFRFVASVDEAVDALFGAM